MHQLKLKKRHTLKEVRKSHNREPAWITLVSLIQPGDEIWTYAESHTFEPFTSGSTGWIALRNGKEVARYAAVIWN